jgi:hypothetical protein
VKGEASIGFAFFLTCSTLPDIELAPDGKVFYKYYRRLKKQEGTE